MTIRPETTPTPWYRDGLRFTCQPRCGACCVGPGLVRLTFEDTLRLERFLGHQEHTFSDDGHLRKFGSRCIFLRHDKACHVYYVRPAQCQTFPFWEKCLTNAETWRQLSFRCPGVNVGRLWTRQEIDAQVGPCER